MHFLCPVQCVSLDILTLAPGFFHSFALFRSVIVAITTAAAAAVAAVVVVVSIFFTFTN